MLDINIIIIQNLSGNLYFCDNCFLLLRPSAFSQENFLLKRKFPPSSSSLARGYCLLGKSDQGELISIDLIRRTVLNMMGVLYRRSYEQLDVKT